MFVLITISFSSQVRAHIQGIRPVALKSYYLIIPCTRLFIMSNSVGNMDVLLVDWTAWSCLSRDYSDRVYLNTLFLCHTAYIIVTHSHD